MRRPVSELDDSRTYSRVLSTLLSMNIITGQILRSSDKIYNFADYNVNAKRFRRSKITTGAFNYDYTPWRRQDLASGVATSKHGGPTIYFINQHMQEECFIRGITGGGGGIHYGARTAPCEAATD